MWASKTGAAAAAVVVTTTLVLQAPMASGSEAPAGSASSSSPDDTYISTRLGIIPADLKLRRALDDELVSLSTELEPLPDFGGMWFEWSPFRIRVATTDQNSRGVNRAVAAFSRPELVELVNVQQSQATLESAMDALVRARDGQSLPAFDASVDVKTNSINIVTPSSDADPGTRIEAVAARTAAGIKIHVANGSLATTTTFGGGNLANGCSSTFMVRNASSGYFGPLSAGHGGCNGSTTYLVGSGIATSVVNPVASGYRDSSLQRLLGGSPSNEIYIDPSPYYRSITGARSWTAIVPGDIACKQARTTRYDCAKMGNKNYSPSYIPNGARFVEVDTPCEGGDSGGSWFSGNTALGVQSGRVAYFDGRVTCLFSSISYTIPSGYALVTS